jgi:L-2-hydroxyglutarate oxidase LhgO
MFSADREMFCSGSLKAQLCRAGRGRLLEFCEVHDIRHEICGKVIVGASESELARLDNLYERGLANGLSVRKLSADEVKEMEPHVCCKGGIHVPETGIVDFVGVCRKLRELSKHWFTSDTFEVMHRIRGIECASTHRSRRGLLLSEEDSENKLACMDHEFQRVCDRCRLWWDPEQLAQ